MFSCNKDTDLELPLLTPINYYISNKIILSDLSQISLYMYNGVVESINLVIMFRVLR